jgi:hypothetical protein
MSRTVSLALAALLLTTACGNAGPVGTDGAHSAGPTGESLSVTRLRAEPYSFTFSSGYTDSARVVVRDARGWEAVWREVWRNETPVPPLPAIDFEREMVVVAALGSRRSGGYGIVVEGARRTAGGVEVSILKQSPGPRCGVAAAITTPADIARLPRVGGAVRFRERSEVRDC